MNTLIKTGEEFKPSITSRIPVSQRSKVKPLLKKQNREITSSQKRMSTMRGGFRSSLKNSNTKPNIREANEGYACKRRTMVMEDREKRGGTSDIFVWKTEKATGKNSDKDDKLLWMRQCPSMIPTDSEASQGQVQKFRKGKVKVGPEAGLEITTKAYNFGTIRQPSRVPCKPMADYSTFGSSSSKRKDDIMSLKVAEDLKNDSEANEKDKKKSDVRHEIGETLPGISRNMSNLQSEIVKERDENTKLRAQIEKLSSFVESSEELRERSEFLLTQQKRELEREIREKDVLKNKVTCLEELRRNLQRKLDEEMKENKVLQNSMKDIEANLCDERENIKAIKKECSLEVSKSAELELVLQTVLEELNNANNLLKKCDNEELDRHDVTFSSYDRTRKWRNAFRYTKNSADYNASSGENWNREKSQFEGKIKLLEMDKKRLRSLIDSLEERIVEHERIGWNLRENNDVLEFRISELECQVLELSTRN